MLVAEQWQVFADCSFGGTLAGTAMILDFAFSSF